MEQGRCPACGQLSRQRARDLFLVGVTLLALGLLGGVALSGPYWAAFRGNPAPTPGYGTN